MRKEGNRCFIYFEVWTRLSDEGEDEDEDAIVRGCRQFSHVVR